MLNFFIKRPVTTIMFVLLWVALGIVAFPKMNIESRPAIDLPMITATFVYPGASPVDIESQVVQRAEDAMSEIAGLKKITSNVFESGAFVMAEFNVGVNVNDKAAEIKAKIDALANDFPDDLRKPVVEKMNPLQESVLDIVISGADQREMDRFVKDVFSQQITALPGVASVSAFGGQERAIRIEMNPELMAARGANILDIVAALGMNNVNIPGGKIESGIRSNVVRFSGEFHSINDIAELRISTVEGENFKLSEIATITDAVREIESGARYDGNDVVIVSVVKASDGNAIKIARDIRNNFPRFEILMDDYFKNHETQPTMQIVSDSSIAVSKETKSTLYGILLGVFLTILTLLIFTRNWRTTVIASIVIPASLISGFFFMDNSGFTINSMSLLAMATALGTLIINAIVLIEAALGFLCAGESPDEAAVKGTKKAVVPVLAAAGTNVVVFLPLAFMGGIAGQFMSQFGMTVVYLTMLSLLFSFTLTPMMIAKILRKTPVKETKQAKCEIVSKKNCKAPDYRKPLPELSWFRKYFDYQIAHPWRVVGMGFVVLILSAFPMRWVGNEFSPNTDIDEISISARGSVGTTYSRSEEIAALIESRLKEFPEVKSTSVKIGERGTQNIGIRVGLVPRSERRMSDKILVQKILPKLSDIPGVEIQITAGIRMPGSGGDLVLNVIGLDDTQRSEYAVQIIDILNKIPEIQSATLAAGEPGIELMFVPDSSKMKYWGVQNQTAAVALRTALYGNDSFHYKEYGNEFPIIIEIGRDYKTRSMFESVFVPTPKGLVALSELGTVEYGLASTDIKRVDKQRITEINIDIGKSTIGPVQTKIETELKQLDFAPGYGAVFGGMSEIQSETTGEISAAFLLAIILTYMLLAAILNSLLHPFTVATSILFSFAGVFIMLFLTGASINIAAMLSIVMLVGLTVNNNILVLEPTIVRISKGESMAKALWDEFVDKKRMLMMTTIAVVAGMVPQLWSADGAKMSMGAVIIGGMVASLFWTFAMTPAIFTAMENLRMKYTNPPRRP
ncbi:MAG: efflux RND transporter permease subunit [Alphaproteobacteria bacterium]|nr:efflux RND transporter permease subunit [Alphaproteobacteria bacterium]